MIPQGQPLPPRLPPSKPSPASLESTVVRLAWPILLGITVSFLSKLNPGAGLIAIWGGGAVCLLNLPIAISSLRRENAAAGLPRSFTAHLSNFGKALVVLIVALNVLAMLAALALGIAVIFLIAACSGRNGF